MTQVLAENGATNWRIVVGEPASPSEVYAAEELQRFLKQMSGAMLPIIRDKEPISSNEILLGENKHLNSLGIDI